ncbi:amidohydrolase family protein [Chryseotalea sanaruensis]|uniref:amidohydrolase family protein n=1 Tax=Chryseotalea sanaruensis TaxID=2482724 RepID=UPI000F8CED2A|nr:amidohydrolase family protein [Chryseotalea sanaruensis]
MKQFNFSCFGRLFLSLALTLPVWVFAQDDQPLAPVSRTYAITNVNIIQAPGRKIDMGTILVKDGIIKAVGKTVSIPPEAIVIKADSMYVYAGFIDGLSRVGVIKPKEETNRERPKDPGNPTNERAGITPQNDVRNELNPADKSLEELRSVGFTTAHVVPYGGMLPGNGSIILLGGSSADNMVLASKTAFYSELTSAQRVYPATVIGVMAKWRELYRQANLSKNYESLYAANRSGLERPTTDRVLEAFYPVIDKRQPVLFKSEKILDIQRVLTLQGDFGFSLMLADVKEGWDVINKIKAANAKMFLSLDLPEAKKEVKEGDKKEGDKKDEKKDDKKAKSAVELEKEALEKRKEEFSAKYTAQPAVFQKAGIAFGFSSLSAKPKDIPSNLRRMIAAGLTEDQALAALTTTPAQLLGLSDRMGSIDNGKMANLVISDKSYFNEKSKVRYVFVDGQLYTLDVKEEKKGDKNGAKASVQGNWSYSTETPQGTNTGKIKLKNTDGTYSGSITSNMSDRETEIKNVAVDGNKLSFTFDFQMGSNTMAIEVNLTIDGTSFDGSMNVGSYGSFPMKGSKDPGL